MKYLLTVSLALLLFRCSPDDNTHRIDRFSLVTRNNVVIKEPDTLGSLSVGNGEFAFTVDVTGLQTFPEVYENGIPLGTQAQWAWHAFPNTNGYKLSDVAKNFESCDGTSAPYAVQQIDGRGAEATNYLRANPHRLHLGLIGLVLTKSNGEKATINDLKAIDQKLDLWTGKIESKFEFEGKPVKVITYALQEDDGISAKIESPLLKKGQIMASLKLPYAKDCHVCTGYDWDKPNKHSWTLDKRSEHLYSIDRVIDSTRIFTSVSLNNAEFKQAGTHEFLMSATAGSEWMELGVVFAHRKDPYDIDFEETARYNTEHWKNFWMSGAALDFSKCTDPRAVELERRVVLSQYLTKIQTSGSYPPQETGLTMNSWYGKFHLEMHWWHGVHFALWNRSSLLKRSLDWYQDGIEPARATAKWQGYKGARWQKMTEPHGHESPSNIGAFIIWQQPHPIYMAELMYRDTPDKVILDRYSDIVFSSADFMASFLKKKDSVYHLCHPLIPAQEVFKATETDDPTYELQYWKLGLSIAQSWRKRLEMPDNEEWNRIINNLAPLPVLDGMYLPNATTPTAYTDERFRRDHPSVLAALGCLPADERIDNAIMQKTLDYVMTNWSWDQTWGWDFPMTAMTAARLGKPETAIDALLMDAEKNTYLVNGHNYQDKRLRLYLPGNGGLLTAVAMMAAGWDGNTERNPGFPKDGKWEVKWEGLKPMP
ncbi:MAG TPA: hypothetical protein VFE50_17310 [Cyclobacteriaceae bacterium]|nr:hypothetical protein [Cyclobacteriaceae bacterium]